jgi:hypothetical protein
MVAKQNGHMDRLLAVADAKIWQWAKRAAEKQVLHQLRPQSFGDGPVTATFHSASLVLPQQVNNGLIGDPSFGAFFSSL